MSKQITLDLPQDAESVTLNIPEHRAGATLRDVLPVLSGSVTLVVEIGPSPVVQESWMVSNTSGRALLKTLEKSRFVDANRILGLSPLVKPYVPAPTLTNGTAVLNGCESIDVYVSLDLTEEARDAGSK